MILTINISLAQWPGTTENAIFVMVLSYGICFDYHPYGDIKCIQAWWLYLCIFYVGVLNFKSDLLYVFQLEVHSG